ILEEDLGTAQGLVGTLRTNAVVVLLGGLLVVVAVALLLSRRLSQPVVELARLTERVRDERDSLQRQIGKLLDEVSTVAEGDLTVQAEVTADALGSVADAFNYMVAQLRGIIEHVTLTSAEAASSTRQILERSGALAAQSERQAQRIAEAVASVDEMAGVAQSVAQNAATGAEIAGVARRNAGEGADAVRQTVGGM